MEADRPVLTLDDLPPRLAKKIVLRANARGGFCWIWTGAINDPRGYGRVKWKGKAVLAHRLFYALAHGRVPPRKVVCHECDTPSCVCPDCLVAGTQSKNMRDYHKRKPKELVA